MGAKSSNDSQEYFQYSYIFLALLIPVIILAVSMCAVTFIDKIRKPKTDSESESNDRLLEINTGVNVGEEKASSIFQSNQARMFESHIRNAEVTDDRNSTNSQNMFNQARMFESDIRLRHQSSS
ncbi:uncharacterized protein LOC129922875 isoform X4 [Biomphalaria glabrata]|uniref:Uncharacterized protein LOC129922875 isoform X3 n=1 Tax=Biomphalaria glabrata TaxID=6526 RepID=A0A9W2YVS3_BIOGL|nr:uncharacterized protein LOC129922875 isoform X3 [Biomphalaria glabrata]XP_055866822.1 uncharacterized protein LOC129922875 isoform X4 [Biomphalaria glabrata]